jgi:sorbitol-specific phosphotransferase system component IIA
MKRTNYHRSDGFLKATILAATLAVATIGGVETASAITDGTAANTTIRNEVTVSYKNNSGTPMADIVRSVDITVDLVDATPSLTLVTSTPQPSDSNTGVDFQYTILSNANGPDRYNLTVASFVESNISGSTNAFRDTAAGGGSAITYVDLGATSVASTANITAASTTVITVPRDLTADGTVNGLSVGDTVTINGADYTVAAVDDANQGLGTTTITLNGNGTAATVNPGDLIQEKATFYLRVTTGSASAAATITTNINARDAANPNQAAATANSQTVINIAMPSLTVTKFVRNVTTPVIGGGTTVSVNNDGSGPYTYYTAGVTGKPGETLEYLIRITNDAGVNPAGTAKGIKISDPIPQFTTYTASSMRLDPGTGTWAALNDNLSGGDAGEWDSSGKVIYIYAGSGGVDTGAAANDGTGGNLADNTTTYGSYKVTID